MPEVLPLARMARRLGVTQTWLRQAADSGAVPCLRAGKRYLFDPEAVATAVAALARDPAPESPEGPEVSHD